MWILITLIVATYLLFNVVIMLIAASEQTMTISLKALLLTLGLPMMIVLTVAAIIEGVKNR